MISPYRSNAFVAARSLARTRPTRAFVRFGLSLPRGVAAAVVAAVAIPLASLNSDVRKTADFVAPDVIRAENVALVGVASSVPLLFLALVLLWTRLPASGATKRRHVRRACLQQLGAVAIAAVAVLATRPSSSALIASAPPSVDGRRAWVYAWDWGCGYRVGVDDRRYGVWIVGEVGPFECDAPPPRLEWRGRDLWLVSADGRSFSGSWPIQP